MDEQHSAAGVHIGPGVQRGRAAGFAIVTVAYLSALAAAVVAGAIVGTQRPLVTLAVADLVDDGTGGRVPAPVAHIARDPLDPAFDDAAFVRRVRSRDSEVKRILLDQTVASGVGNIYADEALWRARLHGARPGRRLTAAQVRELLAAVRAVMGEALEQGGTSFDALYVNVNGESGYFDRSLAAYGQEGEPCPRCATPIRRVAFMNRSSYFCPACQPAPRGTRRPRG